MKISVEPKLEKTFSYRIPQRGDGKRSIFGKLKELWTNSKKLRQLASGMQEIRGGYYFAA
jgi:hypothetical protein